MQNRDNKELRFKLERGRSSKGKIQKDQCLSHCESHEYEKFVLRSFRNNLEENHHLRTRDMSSPEKIGSFTSLTK